MSRISTTILFISILLSCSLAVSGINAYDGLNAHYPDFSIRTASDNHLIVTYTPIYSDDYASVARLSRQPADDRTALGRSFLVTVPPDGDVSYTVNFSRVGSGDIPDAADYITAAHPLVVRLPETSSRGRRLVRFVVFPQRVEQGRLVRYTDFVIDLVFSGSAKASVTPESCRLDTIIAGTTINPEQFFAFEDVSRRSAAFKVQSHLFEDARQWLKITIDESGLYRLTGSDLQQAGVDMTTLRSDSLRLFYSGGITPSPSFSDPQPELYQVAVAVNDGGDGRFDTGDELVFYAQSANRFEYGTAESIYVKNYYDTDNYYWLAVGGHASLGIARWVTTSGPGGTPAITLTTTRSSVRVEQDNLLRVEGDGHIRNFYTWYWSETPDVSSWASLPQAIASDSVICDVSAICDFSGTTVSLNGTEMTRLSGSGTEYRYGVSSNAAVAGLNSIQVNMRANALGTYLDYVNAHYPKSLVFDGTQLEFTSLGHDGLIEYLITGVPAGAGIVDITEPGTPRIVSDYALNGSTAEFRRLAGTEPSRFIAYVSGNLKTPRSIETADPTTLRADLAQYDGVIISPRSFQNALGEYVAHRLATGGYRLKLVAVEDIYDQFGFGMVSPLAIRSYLKFAYENYAPPAPFSALLVGDGHYDFLDNLGLHAASYIPPFIWGLEYSGGDDNFVYFGDPGWLDADSSYVAGIDRGWDMMTARWPVKSSSEVSAYIEKLKRYESDESQGLWRSRITFVADDEYKNTYEGEIIHTAQAETLAVFHTPPAMVQEKIYATDYPFASDGDKPTVNDKIVAAFNNGTLIINYIGHGSPDVWADEHIFKKNIDLGRLRNNDRPAIVIAGSCSIGKFDQPLKEGMAEMLFRQAGGAIATVSATRLVYSRDNAIFSYDLYDAMFGGARNMCEAVFAAKMLHQYERPTYTNLLRNDRTYVVFGDPMGRIGLPDYEVELELSGDSLLTPLDVFGFTGRVLDGQGQPVAIDGHMQINVFDSRFVRHHPLGIDYMLGGPVIFRGLVDVAAGEFTGGFVVPLDIDYGGSDAQVRAFAAFNGVSALGALDALPVATTAAGTGDNQGPTIELAFEEAPDFMTGDRIPANATLVVTLSDNSGLNLTGGLGHRIELKIDNDNNTIVNLTDNFSYDAGSYHSGQVRYRLPDLSPEQHSFSLRAWDNANNPAQVEFDATPAQAGNIAIREVLNYPNPMEEYTEFYFDLSETAEWAEVKIFTLAGRHIKTLKADNLIAGKQRRFQWNGRDLDGDRVAEGVYLYKITVKGRVFSSSSSADNMTEAYGKIILLN